MEVLIRVRATAVNRTDCGVRAGEPLISRLVSGLRRPKWRILETELAGTVEAADVIDATAYVETKQKTGNVVLTLGTWRSRLAALCRCSALMIRPASCAGRQGDSDSFV